MACRAAKFPFVEPFGGFFERLNGSGRSDATERLGRGDSKRRLLTLKNPQESRLGERRARFAERLGRGDRYLALLEREQACENVDLTRAAVSTKNLDAGSRFVESRLLESAFENVLGSTRRQVVTEDRDRLGSHGEVA